MNKAVISLGSNIHAIQHLAKAMQLLKMQFEDVAFSEPKEYAPIDFLYNSDPFTNMVASFDCSIGRKELIDFLKKLEDNMGRKRGADFDGYVSIDLDLIIWNGEVQRVKDCSREYIVDGLKELNIPCIPSANSYFHRDKDNWNCAQSIMKRFQEHTGLSDQEIEAHYRSKGAGKSPGGVCGALYAACQIADRFSLPNPTEAFNLMAGETRCAELKRLNRSSCRDRVKLAEEILLESLKKSSVGQLLVKE